MSRSTLLARGTLLKLAPSEISMSRTRRELAALLNGATGACASKTEPGRSKFAPAVVIVPLKLKWRSVREDLPQLMDRGLPGPLGLHVLQRAIGERDRGSERAHRLSKEDNLVKERQLRQRTAELRIAQLTVNGSSGARGARAWDPATRHLEAEDELALRPPSTAGLVGETTSILRSATCTVQNGRSGLPGVLAPYLVAEAVGPEIETALSTPIPTASLLVWVPNECPLLGDGLQQ